MDISASKLQQLVTIARTNSFSRAAAELNISQPALSRSVAAIEAHYGFQIFDRLGHGVQLTAAGAQAIEIARPLLQTMHVFDDNLKLFGAAKSGALSIGMAPLLASQSLAQFAGEFFDAASRVKLEVVIRSGTALLSELKSGSIELFFFPEEYIEPDPEIDIEVVGTITPACVVRSGHPLTHQKNLKLDDLTGFTWASSVVPAIVEEKLRPARFICDNYHILRDTVMTSDLVGICSLAFVEQQLTEGKLQQIKVRGLPLPETTIYVAKHRDRLYSPLAEKTVARMRHSLTR